MTGPSSDAAVVGAGPAGLMAAETLAAAGVRVTVYDRMASPARKFLLAGRGGLNLTHGEDLATMLSRYGAAEQHLRPAIEAFPPSALRAWSEGLGEPVFVGTSGRVFPTSMKASPLLRAWLRRLSALGVEFKLRHRWTGWSANGALSFETPEGKACASPDVTVLALGGGSWPRLGSDGAWQALLANAGVTVNPLKPANCGFIADFSGFFLRKFEGQPLRGIQICFAGVSTRGEAVVTRVGLEGGAIYALSAPLRNEIEQTGAAIIAVDLQPGWAVSRLESALSQPRGKQSLSTVLRKTAKLSPVAIGLLHDASLRNGTPLSTLTPERLSALIQNVPVRLVATTGMDRAISSAGGVAFDEMDLSFMLKAKPGYFLAGEMLDWEAPTGGYLLQACFSTGAAAARGAMRWLQATSGDKAVEIK